MAVVGIVLVALVSGVGRISHPMVALVHVVLSVVEEVRTGEHVHTVARHVGNDRERNVQRCRTIPPKVDVVCVRDVMDDELARIRLPPSDEEALTVPISPRPRRRAKIPFH